MSTCVLGLTEVLRVVLDVRFSHLTVGIKVTLGIHLQTCLLASYATFSPSLFLVYLKAFL